MPSTQKPSQENGSSSNAPLLRFLTCGGVDDGKSTLIGRLLFDEHLVLQDQFDAIERLADIKGDIDLSLLVDGLQAEREQGITIDVAYRYFKTPRRSFIVADTPGHEQYTRNMATGASTSDLAIILVDARKGVITQTKRHTFICHLLGIRQIILAVNKIDLIDYDEHRFASIASEYDTFAGHLGIAQLTAIPISARGGDNVVNRSPRTHWYRGPTLLEKLEAADAEDNFVRTSLPFRMPVQRILREGQDFRGVSGRVASGEVAVGDSVIVSDSGRETRVARIVTFDGDLDAARAGRSVTLVLSENFDVSRGDLLSTPRDRPDVSDQIAATVLWMAEEPLYVGRSYWLRIGAQTVPAQVTRVRYEIDVGTLEHRETKSLGINEIGFCEIATTTPIVFDAYKRNRYTGGFILVDRTTNATIAAGMISFGLRRADNVHRYATTIDRAARAGMKGQQPRVIWFTGLSGSGKSTIANIVEQTLFERGLHTTLLDGDNVRHGLNKDLGFTPADRIENIRRISEVANLMLDAGLVVICCFISPYKAERQLVRELVGPSNFIEVFVDAPLELCIRRDPKGLYAKALAGEIPNFTGIGSPYEAPDNPSVWVDGRSEAAQAAALRIVSYVTKP